MSMYELLMIEQGIRDGNIKTVLDLIEKGTLDPSATIFQGRNLYHVALEALNLDLLKYLCENTSIDINEKDLGNRYPTEIVLSCLNEHEAKHKVREILNYLLEKPNFNPSLTEASYPYKSPSERAFSGGDTELGIKLRNADYIKSKPLNVKMTFLRFGLSGGTQGIKFESDTLSEKQKSIAPEGAESKETVPDLQYSFNKYYEQFNSKQEEKEILFSVNQSFQNFFATVNGNDSPDNFKMLENAYKQGEMISLYSSAERHCAAIVLHDKTLYRCNKGLNKLPDYTVGIYTILNQNEITADKISDLLETLDPQDLVQTTFRNDGLEGRAQYAGNCTVASPKKAIHAMIYDAVIHKYPNDTAETQKEKAKKIYKAWTAWDRTYQIERLISACADDRALLVSVLKYIYSVGRIYSANHQKIISELREAIGKHFQPIFEEKEAQAIAGKTLINQFKIAPGNLKTLRENTDAIIKGIKEFGFGENLYDAIPKNYHLFAAIVFNDKNHLAKLIRENSDDYLIKIGNGNDDSKKMTLLHIAAACDDGSGDCLKLLIKHYPDLLDFQNEQGCTPLHIAIIERNIHAVKILKEHGAKQTDLGSSLFAPNRPVITMDTLFQMSEKKDPETTRAMKEILSGEVKGASPSRKFP